MLIRIENDYFSFEPIFFDGILSHLQSGQPFVNYQGFTRIKSDGLSSNVSLDGRSVSLSNAELTTLLQQAQQEHLVSPAP